MEVGGQPQRRSSTVERDLRDLGVQLGTVLGRLDEMAKRLNVLDELVDDVRRYGSLTDTVAQQATDTSRRLTNLEQDWGTRIQVVERVTADLRRVQEVARVAEMAPRELAVLPDVCRDYIDRQEEAESLEDRFERRMRIAITYATTANAVFAALAVIVAYWLGHH